MLTISIMLQNWVKKKKRITWVNNNCTEGYMDQTAHRPVRSV